MPPIVFFLVWGDLDEAEYTTPNSGHDVSVTDGRWIITFGQFGLFGFFAEFGLLALPIFRAAAALKYTEPARDNDKVFLAALALILAINIFDLIPDLGLQPWTWLLSGALLGRAEGLSAHKDIPRSRTTSMGADQLPTSEPRREAR